MNVRILEKHNALVKPGDDVYVLGDLMLGNSAIGMGYVRQLNGKLHIVRGNHDTDSRWTMYATLPNVVEQSNAITLKYKKHHFYMSHYPTLTGNLEKESLSQMTLNLFGHTHQQTNFHMDLPYMYHVGVDSHDCAPIQLDTIIQEMYDKVNECKSFLGEEEEQINSPLMAAAYADANKIKEFRIKNCSKCVHANICPGPSWYNSYQCPDNFQYRRDPPDGGFYG